MASERLILAALLIGVIVGALLPFGSESEATEAAALKAVVEPEHVDADAQPALVDQAPATTPPHSTLKRSARN